MSKEDLTCKTCGYRYILALPSIYLKRVLVLVHWKYVLLHNTRKCVWLIIEERWSHKHKYIFVRIKKLYSYVRGLVLKLIVIKNCIWFIPACLLCLWQRASVYQTNRKCAQPATEYPNHAVPLSLDVLILKQTLAHLWFQTISWVYSRFWDSVADIFYRYIVNKENVQEVKAIPRW